MAKSSASRAAVVRYEKPTVIVRAPSAPRGKLRSVAGRGGARFKAHALENKYIYGAVLAAGGLGLAKRMGIPMLGKSIPILGAKGTSAALAWGIALATKSRTAKTIAVGLTCVWLYDLAAGEGTSGDDD